MLQGNIAAAAQTALVGVVRIAFDLYDITVFDVGENAAILMAEIAGRLLHLHTRSMDIDLCHRPSPLLFRLHSLRRT